MKIHKNRHILKQTFFSSSSSGIKNAGKSGILYVKIFVAYLLLIPAILSAPTISIAGYTITQLTNNSVDDYNPQINANGWIVWEEYDGTDYEIYLYNRTAITQITNNSYNDYNPQINANGWVTWYGYDGTDWEIFLYNGAAITQITDNSYSDKYPRINASGWVTWYGYDGTDYEIYLYNGTTITQITNNGYNDMYPQINDKGWVAWEGYDGTDWEIFLYNGTATTQITNNIYNDMYPQINASGWVTWYGYDGTEDEIYLYNGSTIIQMTNNNYDKMPPNQINANGWITWEEYDGTDYEIYLYNGTAITQITNNSYDDYYPQINASGWVTWYGYDGTDLEIFFYNKTTAQLTHNNYDDEQPQINDNGCITWLGYDGDDYEIFLAIPNNDVDHDGDGYTVEQGDCDDNDPAIHPGATEICGDGKDNNCDGNIDEGCTINVIPPSSLTAKAISSTQIVLGWKDNSNNENGFKIERTTGNCSSSNSWVQEAMKNANVTSHTVSGLIPNTTYAFRIRAFQSSTNSTYSNCGLAKTGLSGTPPASTNLRAVSASATKVNLTWEDNSSNETGFRIYRKAGTGAWALLGTTSASSRSFSDATATNNNSSISYQYYVCAYNASGSSPATYPAAVPYQPSILTVTQGTTAGTIILTWKDNSANETGFEIYRKTGACSSTSSWTKVATLGVNRTTWTDTGRTSGNIYSYKVRAYKNTGSLLSVYGYSLFSGCFSETAP